MSRVLIWSRAAWLATALMALLGTGAAQAEAAPQVAGRIDWGLWIDLDGCMHWWADGGAEGYMLDRVDPRTGKPQCLKKDTCLVEPTDTLFATDQATLSAEARRRLTTFFQTEGAFGYAIYGHTDARGDAGHNQRLSARRAAAVAAVARQAGVMVSRQMGLGETRPLAPNDSAANMARNRRVEIVCYRWSK